MGNARWSGVPLKAVLDKASIQAGSRQVTFNGLDKPVLPETPDFVKALDIDHARDGEVMIAYAMNGEDLPWLNGYPVRLVVPGYYGTYWVKHLNEITVIGSVYDGFWMKTLCSQPSPRPGDGSTISGSAAVHPSPRLPSVRPRANGTSASSLPSPSVALHHCGDRRWHRACGPYGHRPCQGLRGPSRRRGLDSHCPAINPGVIGHGDTIA
jgi:DMSO/TMAO reductase YedYZ molybdopterin-dependent catalytic subunit